MSPTLSFASNQPPLKLILLGDGGVGKTSLVRSYIHKSFKDDYLMTVGVDINLKEVYLPGTKKKIRLTVHDIAGQERFQEFRQVFFNGANMVFLVYDVTRPESLDSIAETWLQQLLPTINDENFTVYLIANKVDLDEQRQVKSSQGRIVLRRFKRQFGMLNWVGHLETSAKTRDNVNEAFTNIVEAYHKKVTGQVDEES